MPLLAVKPPRQALSFYNAAYEYTNTCSTPPRLLTRVSDSVSDLRMKAAICLRQASGAVGTQAPGSDLHGLEYDRPAWQGHSGKTE